MSPAALAALADAADALARLARAAAEESTRQPTELLPLKEAARAAGTSLRVVREAIRAGDLAAFGGQRDRTVRRSDVDAWIESRRLRPVAGVDDADIERRMSRIARRRRTA
jgi:hypothetical protein